MDKKKKKKLIKTLIAWAVVIAILGGTVAWITLKPKALEIPWKDLPEDTIVPVTAIGGGELMVGEKKYILAMKNEQLEFYINTDDTDFAVKDLASGKIWHSNPVKEDSNNESFKSMFALSYYTDSDKFAERDSYRDAVKVGKEMGVTQAQLTALPDNKGVRVIYKLGRIWQNFAVPYAMPKEDYEQLYAKASKSDKQRLDGAYRYYPAGRGEGQILDEKLKQTYPLLMEKDMYILTWDLSPTTAQPLAGFKRLEPIMKSLGMTLEKAEQYKKDLKVNIGYSDVFRIYVDYTLDNGSLIVNIPVNEVWQQERLQYRLNRLDMLKNFGAGDSEDEGYIFIPDRSGALMNFNSGKSNQSDVKVPVYGWDNAVLLAEANPSASIAHFPVYGIKRNDGAMFAVIEEGAEIATIAANVSRPGDKNTLNYAYPSFTLTAKDSVTMRSKANGDAAEFNAEPVNTYQKRTYSGDIRVRYYFMSGDDANYTGMANLYRGHLERTGAIKRMTEEQDLPFLVDILGSINAKKSVAGVPTNVNLSLTTYSQAQTLLEGLRTKGVKNINARYKGWANGGIKSSYYNKAKPMSVLGGKDDLATLTEYTKKNNIGFYPDAEFLYVYKNSTFDAFNSYTDSARFLTSGVAYKYTYSPVTGMYNKDTDRAVILRPTMLVEEITSFLKSFKKLNISGLSAGAMGTDLNSDFNESEKLQSNRADTKEHILKGVQSIKNDGLKFMTDGCNEYMLKYTDIIANAPMSNSGYFVCDEVVPFYQMVLHGYVPYISTPLNQADDEQIAFLQAVEMGAGLSYIWMYAENLTLKDITFDIGYSLNYKQWYDSAIEYYNKANSQLKGLSTQLMVDHYRAIEKQDVFVTVYEDGTKVIVNYTDAQVTVENTTVMARDFAVVRG